MKRRIYSSTQPRKLHFDLSEFSKVKNQLIENSRSAKEDHHPKVKYRCNSTAPSSFHTPANFLSMVGYSPQKPPPVLKIKSKTPTSYVSSTSLTSYSSLQNFSKVPLWKFSKYRQHQLNAGKLCQTCEENHCRPRLFKRGK